MKQQGFTLIELMITVAIVAILAAIAYPSYTTQVQKTRRADAQAALSHAALAMEACRADRATYTGCALPRAASEDGHYELTAAITGGGRSYTLTATPAAGSPQTNDAACTSLTLDSRSVRGHTGSASSAEVCWGS